MGQLGDILWKPLAPQHFVIRSNHRITLFSGICVFGRMTHVSIVPMHISRFFCLCETNTYFINCIFFDYEPVYEAIYGYICLYMATLDPSETSHTPRASGGCVCCAQATSASHNDQRHGR